MHGAWPHTVRLAGPRIRRPNRYVDRDTRTAWLRVDVQRRVLAERPREALAYERETVAIGRRGQVESRSIVFDLDADVAVVDGGPHHDRRAFAPRRHRVLDAVLDERLHGEPWHGSVGGGPVDGNVGAQAVAGPPEPDLELVADRPQLLIQ